MTQIEKIEQEAEKYSDAFMHKGIAKESYKAGRLKADEERDKEIERLKGLVKGLRHCGTETCASCNQQWQQFKTENNL